MLSVSHASRHPCFFARDRGKYGRIHLPVAPGCNIECAYCRRDYNCPNENRPGVTKAVLRPESALERLEQALKAMPCISVAAVAGPGDPFFRADYTLRTFELIRRNNPHISLCVATNGLNLARHVHALYRLRVEFVTITINAIDPQIGFRIVDKLQYNGKVIKGLQAAQVLIEAQLEAIDLLKRLGFIVKVNTVVIKGLNDVHIPSLAKKMAALEVDIMNLMPLAPLAGTAMENARPPGQSAMRTLRAKAARFLPQMSHCSRCRADAVGLLADDNDQLRKTSCIPCL